MVPPLYVLSPVSFQVPSPLLFNARLPPPVPSMMLPLMVPMPPDAPLRLRIDVPELAEPLTVPVNSKPRLESLVKVPEVGPRTTWSLMVSRPMAPL